MPLLGVTSGCFLPLLVNWQQNPKSRCFISLGAIGKTVRLWNWSPESTLKALAWIRNIFDVFDIWGLLVTAAWPTLFWLFHAIDDITMMILDHNNDITLVIYTVMILDQWFSTPVSFRGYFAMSGDNFVMTGGEVCRYLVGKDQGCCQHPTMHRRVFTTKNHPAPKVTSAKDQNLPQSLTPKVTRSISNS